eukprot:1294920-Amphidinium_carterae.2
MSRYEAMAVSDPNVQMNEQKIQRSGTLYHILMMLLEGRTQTMLTNTPTGRGYELWRRLVAEYELRRGSRSASLLAQILSCPFEGTGEMGTVHQTLRRDCWSRGGTAG